MDWFSLLECDDYFNLVENIQQQEMVSLFCDMNYVISTYVEEFDNDNNKHYQHFHKNILIKTKKNNILQHQFIRYLHL